MVKLIYINMPSFTQNLLLRAHWSTFFFHETDQYHKDERCSQSHSQRLIGWTSKAKWQKETYHYYNHLLSLVLSIILFLFILLVCGNHYLPTLFLVVAFELLKVSLGLFTLLRCLCFLCLFACCTTLCLENCKSLVEL